MRRGAGVWALCILILELHGAQGFALSVPSLIYGRHLIARSARGVRGGRSTPREASMASAESGSSGNEVVDIVTLLGCCVCACERAAKVIRAVEAKRSVEGVIEGAVLKDQNGVFQLCSDPHPRVPHLTEDYFLLCPCRVCTHSRLSPVDRRPELPH